MELYRWIRSARPHSTIALAVVAAALTAANPASSQEREVYICKHTVVETEEGSPVWKSYSEEERARYLKETEEGPYLGKPADVADTFIWEPRENDRAAFCLVHVGHLMHICSISGVAERQGAGYIYKDSEIADCTIKIQRSNGTITFEDVDSRCRQSNYCGARSQFEGAEFSSADRVVAPDKVREAEEMCELP